MGIPQFYREESLHFPVNVVKNTIESNTENSGSYYITFFDLMVFTLPMCSKLYYKEMYLVLL